MALTEFGVGSELSLYINNTGTIDLDPFQAFKKVGVLKRRSVRSDLGYRAKRGQNGGQKGFDRVWRGFRIKFIHQ